MSRVSPTAARVVELWAGLALGLLAACDAAPPAPAAPAVPSTDHANELAETGCAPLPPISGFVGRQDGALLFDGFAAYRATGTNLYYLQQLLSYAQQDQDKDALRTVGEVLDDLVCLSLPVARIWGFNDSKDLSSIRFSPEEGFREEGLRGLDQPVGAQPLQHLRERQPLVAQRRSRYGAHRTRSTEKAAITRRL